MSAEPSLPPELLSWLERVDDRWRSCGVDVATRARMGADLADDLRQALAADATSAELTSEDPVAFADRVASAHQASSAPPPDPAPATPRNVVLTGMAGAAVGGLVVWIFLIPYLVRLVPAGGHEIVGALVVYAVCGMVVMASCLGAIAHRFRDDSTTGRMVRYIGPSMLLFGLLSVLPAVGLAWLLGFNAGAAGVTLVGLLVLGFVAAGIYAGQWLARRPASAG